MIPTLLTVKALFRQLDDFDTKGPWVCLRDQWPHSYLIQDTYLAIDILKHKAFLPDQLLDLWKRINRLDTSSLPYLTQYFQNVPLLLSGEDHENSRNAFRKIYKSIESDLEITLQEANYTFFKTEKKPSNPIEFLTKYIDYISRSILAKELSINANDVPGFDGYQLFQFTPSINTLQNYEKRLGVLIDYVERKLQKQHRSIFDIWPLISIPIMGQEPLLGALAYGLLHPRNDGLIWSGESLAFYSAPVSVFTRIPDHDMAFGDLYLKAGDFVIISPSICNRQLLQNTGTNTRSMSFGHGAHVCPGRIIANKIIDAFFQDINGYSFDINVDIIKLKRDFNLIPIKTKE